MWRLIFIQILVLSITACVSYSQNARHEAFVTMYGRQVGLNADDLERSWLARYPKDIVASRNLSNGNTEIEVRTSSGSRCRVFYEVEPESRTIVRWRFDGSKVDCTWVP